jgi:hypothetical protein
MYYVEIETNPQKYNVYVVDDYKPVMIPTTRLAGPFRYRKDVETHIETNKVIRVLQIE